MNLRSLFIVGATLVVAMLAVSVWAWPQVAADAQVPIHWGPDGQPDGYGPKWFGLLGMPAITVGIIGLFALIPRIEPRRANLERSGTAYIATAVATVAFLAGLHLVAVLAVLGNEVDITTVAVVSAAVLFIVIGNFLGKTRSNWLFGIRTPWTLSSERAWAQTHRLGGWLFIAMGLAVLVATVVLGPMAALWVLLGGILGSIVVLVAYSYRVWRDDPARQRNGTAL